MADLEPLTDVLTTAMVSAFLLGMRREFDRAVDRGVDLDADPAEAVIKAAESGERQALEEIEDFAELSRQCGHCGEGTGFLDFQEFTVSIIQGGEPIMAPKEAVSFLRDKVPLRSKTVETLVRASRKRGILTSATFAADLRGLIDEEVRILVEEGASVEEGVERINGVIEAIGLDPVAPARLQTILRTNVNAAYNAGRAEMLKDPAVAAAFPFLIYRTMEDNRVRPEHRKMNNKAYRTKHPIWRIWFPPNGFNCRCTVVPADAEDLKALGIGQSRVAPKDRRTGRRAMPDEGFRLNPAVAFKRGGISELTGAQRREARKVIAGTSGRR